MTEASVGGGAALEACRAYDHWASEIRRLTAAIGDCLCPKESDESQGEEWASGGYAKYASCFRRAAEETFPGHQPDDGPTRRDLDAIAKAVADCPACSLLCTLIRDRKHARQQWGVAKRKIRVIGRTPSTPTPASP